MIRELGLPGDLGWVIKEHGERYAREYGWDRRFEALVARVVADYAAAPDLKREAAWIAEIDGHRVGSIFCVDAHEDNTALLRLLLVGPQARGHGVGAALVDVCIEFARKAGYRRMRLWTTHPLAEARRMYLRRGFRLIAEEPHDGFGADLIGQTYQLDFGPPP